MRSRSHKQNYCTILLVFNIILCVYSSQQEGVIFSNVWESPDQLTGLAAFWASNGHHSAASQAYRIALKINSTFPLARALLTESLRNFGDPIVGPEAGLVYARLAESLLLRGDINRAQSIIDLALEADPGCLDARVLKCLISRKECFTPIYDEVANSTNGIRLSLRSALLDLIEVEKLENPYSTPVWNESLRNRSCHSCRAVGNQSDSIPRLAHFVYVGTRPFLLHHYIAIKSAYVSLGLDCICFHHTNEPPPSIWWTIAKTYVTPVPASLISEMFGIPVTHPAHRSDLMRLKILQSYGGVYMDLDVWAVRDVESLLLSVPQEVILAKEGENVVEEGGSPEAIICSAFLMARAHAPFLQRWLDSYRTFDNEQWNYHSGIVPARLAMQFPREAVMLEPEKVLWPPFDFLHEVYEGDNYDFEENYAFHLYENQRNRHRQTIALMTLDDIWNKNTTSFYRLARRILEWDGN
mmetsp:Transcript_3580/g.5445  ORF Transcript_3580/g.5445 Transcript_3580/m.5445 type:complete len:468 (-) Transcript_3580:40-1443(-)|eukprot:CAMPEP_0184648418 /NCGR_PEP_ID=MMETSP0308-20130426/5539_1 /TAXON_ID=38269 /ORGANISM="Gloeochaete witrockiana, Strain SAG 46.84" /LENGTH=467 /DNA_ID=CAMNT_0027080227 /DNA_START=89 /DNA_END=1492 /DNA_ORIENTATION=-